MKRLIVNADDFGFTRDVNEGIVEAHLRGILTSTTLMANGSAFHHAVMLARDTPSLDIGVHLVLVGERALSRPNRALPASPYELPFDRSLDIERELDLQIRRVLDGGIRPTHLDTHKHTHVLPWVAAAVSRLSQAYGIPWVRQPLPRVGAWSRKVLLKAGCRLTDHFIGFRQTGSLDTPSLVQMLHALPDGLTELMVHPGFCTDELLQSRTRLKQSRQVELEALVSPAVRHVLESREVRLVGFAALGERAGAA